MNMQRLMAAEFFKLRKRMMTWVVGVLILALILLLYTVLWSVAAKVGTYGDNNNHFTGDQLRRALFLQSAVPFALQLVSQFGTLLAVILAAGAAGGEYSWGTVRLMATASSGRLRLITARLLVVWGLIAFGALLAVFVAVVYSTIITIVSGGADFSFVDAAFVRDQVYAYGRTLFVIAPYVTMAFAAAVIGRSTLAGVGTGLGVAFLEPVISGLMRLAGSPWRDLPNYLINANMQVVLLQNNLPEILRLGPSGGDLQRRGVHSVGGASLILLAYVVVFVSLAFFVYRRRDIQAGTSS